MTSIYYLLCVRHAAKCWGCKDHEAHKPKTVILAEMCHFPSLLSSSGTAHELESHYSGRTGFPVKPFIDLDDPRLRTMQSQEAHTSLWKLPSLNCFGENHLPGVAGLFPLTIFHVSFGFISLLGKDFPLMIFFVCLFLSAEVVVEILSGVKGMHKGALRKPRSWKSPFVPVCPQHPNWSPCSASLLVNWGLAHCDHQQTTPSELL